MRIQPLSKLHETDNNTFYPIRITLKITFRAVKLPPLSHIKA